MTVKTITSPVYEIEFTDEERETCDAFATIIESIQKELVTHNVSVESRLTIGETNPAELRLYEDLLALAYLIERYGKLTF